jgi:hypothetical protein
MAGIIVGCVRIDGTPRIGRSASGNVGRVDASPPGSASTVVLPLQPSRGGLECRRNHSSRGPRNTAARSSAAFPCWPRHRASTRGWPLPSWAGPSPLPSLLVAPLTAAPLPYAPSSPRRCPSGCSTGDLAALPHASPFAPPSWGLHGSKTASRTPASPCWVESERTSFHTGSTPSRPYRKYTNLQTGVH